MKSLFPKIYRNNKIRYFVVYTIAFLFIYIIGYSEFFFGNYKFISYTDVIDQHFPALVYMGEYMRALPGHILSGEIPMYDFSIGLGDDIFAPLLLHSANIDILNMLFAFVPREGAYVLFVVIMMLRLYLSGLAFSYFCFTTFPAQRENKKGVLIGSLIYIFSGWVIFNNMHNPNFIIALLYMPLILAGFDKILQNKKPYLFIITVFMLGLASFYYLYMVIIFIIIYAIIRIHQLYGSDFFKSVLIYGLKSTGYFVVGFAMSAITVLPTLTATFSLNREAYTVLDSLLHYPLMDYITNFISFPAPVILGYPFSYAQLGMSAVVPVAIIILISKWRVHKHLSIGVIIAFVISSIPLGAFALNGFVAVSNRPEFLLCFTCTVAFVFIYQNITVISKSAKIILAAYTGILFLLINTLPGLSEEAVSLLNVGAGFVTLFFILLLIPVDNSKLNFITERRKKIILGIVVVLNLTINISPFLSVGFRGFVLKDAFDMYKYYIDVQDYVDDDSFYRQGTPFSLSWFDYNREQYVNSAMELGYNGVSEYWTLSNPAYAELLHELENADQAHIKWRVDGVDNRTVLNQLVSVKYLFTTIGNGTPPTGYEHIADVPLRRLYINKYALPIGYTYEKSISVDKYGKLHPLDKQDTLIQAVVLSEKYANADLSHISFQKTEIPFSVSAVNGLTWENGIMNVRNGLTTSEDEQSAALVIDMQNQSVCTGNCETYVRLVGFNAADDSKNTVGLFSADIESGHETANKSYRYSTKYVDQFHGRENHLINLGYYKEPVERVILSFIDNKYALDKIEVYCVPMDDYPKMALALGEDVLENINIGINSVTGDISLEKDKVLVFSIPYSEGWSCKVNGESTKLLRANTAFMAILLNEGEYAIELTYETPGIRLGAILSLAGFIAFVGVIIYHKNKSNSHKINNYSHDNKNFVTIS